MTYRPDESVKEFNDRLAKEINRYWAELGVEANAQAVEIGGYAACTIKSDLTGHEFDPSAY